VTPVWTGAGEGLAGGVGFGEAVAGGVRVAAAVAEGLAAFCVVAGVAASPQATHPITGAARMRVFMAADHAFMAGRLTATDPSRAEYA
jgi:hypothetical protein